MGNEPSLLSRFRADGRCILPGVYVAFGYCKYGARAPRTAAGSRNGVLIMRKFGRLLAILSVLGAFLTLTGCNTIAGVGDDISGSARAVQHSL